MQNFESTRITFLLTVFTLCIIFSIHCIAQQETGTLSGTVIDKNGEPIEGFSINLSTIDVISKTDEKGAFTFRNIPPGPVQIGTLVQQLDGEMGDIKSKVGLNEPDNEIHSIKIGNITIFQDREPHLGSVKFGIKPGTHIQNVVVVVQPRTRIRTRVLFKDGTPLSNSSISIDIKHKNVGRGGSGRSSLEAITDPEGYFVYYIQKDSVPADYTVSVQYNGISVESEPKLIEAGTRFDDFVLTLDSEGSITEAKQINKSSVNEQPSNIPTQIEAATVATPNSTPQVKKLKFTRDRKTWVVNPANGHAYKMIRCSSLADAEKQASAEGAYLVTIQDEAEQKWISGVFGYHLYWIGLSDSKTEGEWVWQNGEQLTYTNWGAKRRFPQSIHALEEQDTAVMTFLDGVWLAIGPKDLYWNITKRAILEVSR